MSDLILQLANADNWEQVYTVNVTAERPTPTTHRPIGAIAIPVLVDSPIVACYAENPNARPTWYRAGSLVQKIRIGVVVGGQPDTESFSARRVYLKQISLAIFPTLQAEYELIFRPVFWHDQMNLTLWKYTGSRSDTTIQALAQVLGRVESANTKLDVLIGLEGINGNP